MMGGILARQKFMSVTATNDLSRLREGRKGVRVRHSFFGMMAAWSGLQCAVILLTCVFYFSTRSATTKASDLVAAFPLLGLFALYSGVICTVAWAVIALPVYWYWPRRAGFWHPVSLFLAGGLGGGAVGFFCSLPLRLADYRSVAAAVGYSVVPGLIGGVSALVAGGLEELLVRRMAVRRSMRDIES